MSSTELGKAGREAGFQEKIKRSLPNQLRRNNHSSTQAVVLKHHFSGLLLLGLGKERHQMTPEHLETPESQGVIKDNWGPYRRTNPLRKGGTM